MHDHLVQAGAVTPGQVQADELRVRVVGGIVWLAMGISVASRLWLGGPVAALLVFRQSVRTGGRGLPRLVVPDALLSAQIVKRYARRRVGAVERRIVRGGVAAMATMLTETAVINTAYIERLNATFRARLAPLEAV